MAEVSNSKLLHINTGTGDLAGACVVIIKTEWNAAVINELEKGCVNILKKQGVDTIRIIEVPGAVEIPFAIQKYWSLHKYRDDRPHAFIALGCVIRGGTPHFDYVCNSVTDGITQLNLTLPVPVIFGVLTVDNQQQADERLGGIHGHKGEEAAITAIKMISLVKSLSAKEEGKS
ncbi:MAG: 6,7-dimethyl-8-ribityllumazine synthase [Chitinophagaceae bacterium]|nr:6,7-dimethyl-8-ribityllumazine synthase [Chitinophagaceae bacterium]